MRDRVLVYAIGISVLVHLAGVCVIGHTSASRLSTPTIFAKPRYIKVDLVSEPKSDPAKPPQAPVVSKPTRAPDPPPDVVRPTPNHVRQPANPATPTNPVRTQPGAKPTRALPGNPGGALNTGTASRGGDLTGMGNSGKTPSGWVPGEDHGGGLGSGDNPGRGTPDPPKHADDGPGTKPAPAPPPVQMVSAKICTVSGDLAGKWCDHTKNESYVEGHQPRNTCDKCKEPKFVSRTADRANPELIHAPNPDIPSSVEEGLHVRVEVSYTVTTEGSVSDVKVVKSSGVRAVDRACTDAASKRKYKPAVQDGTPRSVKMVAPYVINT